MATGTRDRMIEAAVLLLQRRGLSGMSFSDVIASSGAARGAIYHHFPRGKEQLAAEAAARNGLDVRGHLAALPDGSPRAVVEAFLAGIRPVIEGSAHGAGCAVAAVTVEVPARAGAPDPGPPDDLRAVAAAAFDSWTAELCSKLSGAGMPAGEAQRLATLLVTVLEGAHVLCRAARDIEPFDQAAASLLSTVA